MRVNRGRDEAELSCSCPVSLDQLQAAVGEDGYTLAPKGGEEGITVGEDGEQKQNSLSHTFNELGSNESNRKKKYAEIGAAFLVLVGLYLILKQLDLLPQSIGVTDTMSYGFVFLIGLVAATSTCIAVSGGLLLAVATKFNERFPHLNGMQKFTPHLYFNVGRIVSYTIFGALIGLLGSVLTLSAKVTGIFMILVSILMIVMGIQLLQIFPWFNRVQVKMPKFIAHRIYDASARGNIPGNARGFRVPAFLFGGATFFLPCGFTQALQLYVLSKGDFVLGALTMLAFSLGTAPSLISLGALTSFTKGSFHRYFTTFAAVLIIVLGIFNIPNGVALTGASFASLSFDASPSSQDSAVALDPNVKIVDGKQIVEMKVNGLDYAPSRFTILAGVPVEWRIDGRKSQGCAQIISVLSLGITEYLSRDKIKVITFTPEKEGTIQFSCSMGMAGPGVFTVVKNTQAKIESKTDLSGTEKTIKAGDTCDAAVADCAVQKLSMEISREKGFFPNTFTVKKDIPVELEIDAKLQLGGCMSTVIIPDYDVAHFISIGKSTLKFTPTKEGVVPITCSMGSRMGQFTVTN